VVAAAAASAAQEGARACERGQTAGDAIAFAGTGE
jgi:hypothetical protein